MERLERDFFRTIKILVEIMGDDFWIFKSVSELKLLKYCKLYESQFKNDCLVVSSPIHVLASIVIILNEADRIKSICNRPESPWSFTNYES